jgi:hypothetical protein
VRPWFLALDFVRMQRKKMQAASSSKQMSQGASQGGGKRERPEACIGAIAIERPVCWGCAWCLAICKNSGICTSGAIAIAIYSLY